MIVFHFLKCPSNPIVQKNRIVVKYQLTILSIVNSYKDMANVDYRRFPKIGGTRVARAPPIFGIPPYFLRKP